MNKLFRTLLILILVLFSTEFVLAQDLFKDKNLSQVQVDKLTDSDIIKFKAQISNSGLTIAQVEQNALAKGMSTAEFAKLKKRLDSIKEFNKDEFGKLKMGQKSNYQTSNLLDTLDISRDNQFAPKKLIDPLIFGSELYSTVSLSFEPNLRIATPLNYILGPDDNILISVYGVQQYEGDLSVSAEGFINIPNVGQVKVAGLTIEAATDKIKRIMGNTVYTFLKSGQAKLTVTLGKIRSIKVLVIGAIRPGTYTLSSLSTAFNALYAAGGPSTFGSFRQIEVLRDNKIFRKIDLYRFLLSGDQTDNVGLKDNDVIRIPTYKSRIEIQGQVKRPGYFEVLPGENFEQILQFASGFTDSAYKSSVKILQRSEKERKVADLDAKNYSSYNPQTGDVFVVSKILNRFENRVRISGSVFRPDLYQLKPGMTIADLIQKADGLKEDAYRVRGQVIRFEENLTRSILSFDIKKAIAGDPQNNFLLKREDEVFISSILDLKDSLKVSIQGEIRIPDEYEYVSELTLKDLILQAGGFTDAASQNIEIARIIKRDSAINTNDNRAAIIINTQVSFDLSTANDIILHPFDVVTVRKKAGYNKPENVFVYGQVQYPGPYALSNQNERISDILKRAGGYTPDAYPEGAYLKRTKAVQELEKSKKELNFKGANLIDTLNNEKYDARLEVLNSFDRIPLDMNKIVNSPKSVEDLIVRASDELFIPKFDAQVKISGGVLFPTQIPYSKSNSLKDYINKAGGYSNNASANKSYVLYSNGSVATVKKTLFIKRYPKILPGSEIVVPQNNTKKGISTAEIIGLSSTLVSLASVVIALLRII